MTKEVVKAGNTQSAPAVIGDDTDFDLLFSARGAGLSNVRAEDMAIPFISIIQSNSPQRKKQDGAYIQGADEGMVFNTVTQELFDITPDSGTLEVLLCAFKKKYLHWRKREEGGGMLGQYEIGDPIAKTGVQEGGRIVLPDGTYLVETAEHYVLVVYPDGTAKRAVIAMSSTQLKKSRRWMTMAGEKQVKNPATGEFFTAPSFYFTYKLSTQAEKNDSGDWQGWRIAEGRQLNLADAGDKSIFKMALEFQKSVDKGEVEVAENRGDATSSTPKVDEDIPF